MGIYELNLTTLNKWGSTFPLHNYDNVYEVLIDLPLQIRQLFLVFRFYNEF